MSDSNGTRRIFQQIPMDSIGFQRIPMDFTGKNMKKSENVGKSRKFMIRLFMIRLWPFPNFGFCAEQCSCHQAEKEGTVEPLVPLVPWTVVGRPVDGRRRRACRQRRRKKNHLIEAAPFGRLDQMWRTTVLGGGLGGLCPPAKNRAPQPKISIFFFK